MYDVVAYFSRYYSFQALISERRNIAHFIHKVHVHSLHTHIMLLLLLLLLVILECYVLRHDPLAHLLSSKHEE